MLHGTIVSYGKIGLREDGWPGSRVSPPEPAYTTYELLTAYLPFPVSDFTIGQFIEFEAVDTITDGNTTAHCEGNITAIDGNDISSDLTFDEFSFIIIYD